jgi:hypothetical protein
MSILTGKPCSGTRTRTLLVEPPSVGVDSQLRLHTMFVGECSQFVLAL